LVRFCCDHAIYKNIYTYTTEIFNDPFIFLPISAYIICVILIVQFI